MAPPSSCRCRLVAGKRSFSDPKQPGQRRRTRLVSPPQAFRSIEALTGGDEGGGTLRRWVIHQYRGLLSAQRPPGIAQRLCARGLCWVEVVENPTSSQPF